MGAEDEEATRARTETNTLQAAETGGGTGVRTD